MSMPKTIRRRAKVEKSINISLVLESKCDSERSFRAEMLRFHWLEALLAATQETPNNKDTFCRPMVFPQQELRFDRTVVFPGIK